MVRSRLYYNGEYSKYEYGNDRYSYGGIYRLEGYGDTYTRK